ncbi:Uncharacterized membrane protein [Marinobacter salarius]|jgi:uncharacterized membrane protein|uniref:Membrane protein n=1 Tax=Marinobacter salarius TaxID=1420917 RepID=W5YT35_9GAMM|nr:MULTISPECIES: DUF2069 domain-containing protein [Marinobacter]AHI32220.1 membrane protein [Marinobacter salarius]KXJ47788.1 MAG: hypothetical protein AXW11_07515 [Marinobacter sp. Hex_13]MBL84328.1 DUF2069 domain-containing protein [Marinobacter sp.]SFL98959.1 Uncharacterized membrane protein [Marinobacter salarius]|tara:strand:+ start:2689 stop:3057 length:369 start_codon:yes stop_codon:yes gene_type:complete
MLHNPKARITARLTILLYLATLAALLVSTFYPVQVEGVSVTLMLSVKLVPLLAFAVPVFRGHNRGYIWLSFVVIFYFTQYVVSSWLSEGAITPLIIAVLTFLLFTVAMVHLKVNRPQPVTET